MDISTYSTHEQQRRLAPASSPATSRRRYTETLKTEHQRVLRSTRKGWLLNIGGRTPHKTHQWREHARRLRWNHEEREDGRRLAFDRTVALPGEGHRNTPRLERQEAFRAPKTWNVSDTDIVVDDAELYRLGILYDGDQENDYVHSSGFCLDAIVHPDPVYSLRPTKRVKRSHDNRLPPLEYEDLHLSIELLSAYLGDDAAIARFLTPVGDDERARLYHVDFNDPNNNKNALTEGVGTTEPSTVIYELSESSTPSLTPASAMNDFPGLTSNRGKEGDEEYEEDSNFDDGWALVVGSSITANAGTSHAAVRIDVDGNEETAAAANDAWVLIAGDDS